MPRKRNPEPTVSVTMHLPISVYQRLVEYTKNSFPPTTISALTRTLVMQKLKEMGIIKEEGENNENS
jgi:hypothetical protein